MRSRLVRDQAGFTIIELLVTMSLMLVVLFATLSAFDAFSSESGANSRLTEAQDSGRREVDAITRALRNAAPVNSQLDPLVRPTSSGAVNDVIFATYGTEDAGVAKYVRYCVNTSTRTLWREEAPAAGATEPGAECPSTGPLARAALLAGSVANTASLPAFTVDSTRRAVGIDLRVDGGRNSGTRVQSVRSAAYLRSYSGRAPNIDASDITVTCSTSGGKKTALLQLGVGIGGGGNPLEASYSILNVPVGTGAVKIAVDTPVQVAVTVTNLLGLKQLLTKTVTC